MTQCRIDDIYVEIKRTSGSAKFRDLESPAALKLCLKTENPIFFNKYIYLFRAAFCQYLRWKFQFLRNLPRQLWLCACFRDKLLNKTLKQNIKHILAKLCLLKRIRIWKITTKVFEEKSLSFRILIILNYNGYLFIDSRKYYWYWPKALDNFPFSHLKYKPL